MCTVPNAMLGSCSMAPQSVPLEPLSYQVLPPTRYPSSPTAICGIPRRVKRVQCTSHMFKLAVTAGLNQQHRHPRGSIARAAGLRQHPASP